MRIGIVVSEWYWEEITSKMLQAAQRQAHEQGMNVEVMKCPGSFDIPLPVKMFLKREDIDGVVTLGAIIEGKTDHDKVIAHALTKTLMELSLEFEKPVVLGVNGPGMSREQAVSRIERAGEVMQACIDMVKALNPST